MQWLPYAQLMPRKARMFVVLIAPLLAAILPLSPASPASAATTPSYVLVDYENGGVIKQENAREAKPPASITKLMTALVVTAHVKEDQPITISANAARMPAMKIGLLEGQTWKRNDLLYSMLMVSANDASVALAEASAGSLEGFARQRAEAAKELGLSDSPVFNDPAGLDDADSFMGGDMVSARDMAIITRSALQVPVIAQIVSTKRYEFMGGDNANHVLNNHNQMLKNYAGSIGVKTGYTSKARHTMIAAATRNGRTFIAISIGGDNPYAVPGQLLDEAFASIGQASSYVDTLPEVVALQAEVAQPVVEAEPPAPINPDQTWVRLGGWAFIIVFVGAMMLRRGQQVNRKLAEIAHPPHSRPLEPAP